MNEASFSTITADDVETFRRKIQKRRKTNSPAKAEKRLIASGALTEKGEPRWPVKKDSTK